MVERAIGFTVGSVKGVSLSHVLPAAEVLDVAHIAVIVAKEEVEQNMAMRTEAFQVEWNIVVGCSRGKPYV